MNKYLFYLLSLLLILLISVISVSAVNNTHNNNITNDKIISMSDNEYYNLTFNKLNSSFNFLYSNYSLNNKGLVLNNVSFDDFNPCVNIENQTLINDSINLIKSYLYNKNINNKPINANFTNNSIINSTNVSVNKTDFNNNLSAVNITGKTNISLVNDSTISYNDSLDTSVNISINSKLDNKTPDITSDNSTTVYPDTSNLGNNSVDKNNKSNVLFNDTLHNQNQYNKSFKVFELDKDSSINDKTTGLNNGSISEKLNSSEINNISNNNFSKDNHINHVSEPKNSNDYIMLLIPILLVLLGAIILYNKNKI